MLAGISWSSTPVGGVRLKMQLTPLRDVDVSDLGAAIEFLVSARFSWAASASDGREVLDPPMLEAVGRMLDHRVYFIITCWSWKMFTILSERMHFIWILSFSDVIIVNGSLKIDFPNRKYVFDFFYWSFFVEFSSKTNHFLIYYNYPALRLLDMCYGLIHHNE